MRYLWHRDSQARRLFRKQMSASETRHVPDAFDLCNAVVGDPRQSGDYLEWHEKGRKCHTRGFERICFAHVSLWFLIVHNLIVRSIHLMRHSMRLAGQLNTLGELMAMKNKQNHYKKTQKKDDSKSKKKTRQILSATKCDCNRLARDTINATAKKKARGNDSKDLLHVL